VTVAYVPADLMVFLVVGSGGSKQMEKLENLNGGASMVL
jgi:hypothetical protein